MRITISGKNVHISDALRQRIEKKLGKLDRFLVEDEDVQVRLSQARGGRNTVEITIMFDGIILRAEETNPDMFLSVDKAVDIIVRQIRRHRTKLEKRLRAGVYEQQAPDFELQDEAVLVRTKRFVMKPMSVDDAIAQMDLLNHNFFLFLNVETDCASVVYKRVDGNYGLLEAENA
ncbi:MAG: ribosome hibernation-promoting factor, HPF/YfiA family [Candidatus Excrementavichristensenella sp.]|jgi:putative sigma-54 modulation protein|nr:ribosome-associated translation inhibitor RaiA [Bacillota bacterium]NLL54809.1 ribosome-associated translation inhibitor RaiA [Clostridiales bacterium]